MSWMRGSGSLRLSISAELGTSILRDQELILCSDVNMNPD